MKKVLIAIKIAFLSSMLFWVSCTKENTESVERKHTERTMYDKLVTMSSAEAKVAFNLLTPQERYDVWYTKHNDMLDTGNYNQDQINYINYVMNSYTPDVFDTTSEIHTIYKTSTLPTIIEDAQGLFSNYEVFELFFSLSDDYFVIDPGVSTDASCHCNIGSLLTCGKWVVFYTYTPYLEPTVVFVYGDCSNDNCDAAKIGCGGLWLSGCNGSVCTY